MQAVLATGSDAIPTRFVLTRLVDGGDPKGGAVVRRRSSQPLLTSSGRRRERIRLKNHTAMGLARKWRQAPIWCFGAIRLWAMSLGLVI